MAGVKRRKRRKEGRRRRKMEMSRSSQEMSEDNFRKLKEGDEVLREKRNEWRSF